jgi:hypothetical protein
MQSRNGTRFNALDGRSMRVLSESKAKRDRSAFTHMPPAEPSRHRWKPFWQFDLGLLGGGTAAVNCSAETLR